MNKRARIINFRDADAAADYGLEDIISIYDEKLDELSPLLFVQLDGFKYDSDWEDDQLIFIDSSWYMVEGDGDRITVVATQDPLSLASLLESGLTPAPGCKLPILRDVEILLSGNLAPVRRADDLASLGIYLEPDRSLLLDERWERTGSGHAPHFRTEIWRSNDRQFLLETTIKAERPSSWMVR